MTSTKTTSTTDFSYHLSKLREIIEKEVDNGGEIYFNEGKWTCSDDEDEESKLTNCKIWYLDEVKTVLLEDGENSLENKVKFTIYQELYNEMCDREYGANDYQEEIEDIGNFIIKSEKKKKPKIESKEKPKIESKDKPIRVKLNDKGEFEVESTGLIVDKETQKVTGKRLDGNLLELTEDDKLYCKKIGLEYCEKPKVVIIKNIYGYFEHKGTGFVFDDKTRKVFGKQVGDKIVDLSDDDKLKCKEFLFQYE